MEIWKNIVQILRKRRVYAYRNIGDGKISTVLASIPIRFAI